MPLQIVKDSEYKFHTGKHEAKESTGFLSSKAVVKNNVIPSNEKYVSGGAPIENLWKPNTSPLIINARMQKLLSDYASDQKDKYAQDSEAAGLSLTHYTKAQRAENIAAHYLPRRECSDECAHKMVHALLKAAKGKYEDPLVKAFLKMELTRLTTKYDETAKLILDESKIPVMNAALKDHFYGADKVEANDIQLKVLNNHLGIDISGVDRSEALNLKGNQNGKASVVNRKVSPKFTSELAAKAAGVNKHLESKAKYDAKARETAEARKDSERKAAKEQVQEGKYKAGMKMFGDVKDDFNAINAPSRKKTPFRDDMAVPNVMSRGQRGTVAVPSSSEGGKSVLNAESLRRKVGMQMLQQETLGSNNSMGEAAAAMTAAEAREIAAAEKRVQDLKVAAEIRNTEMIAVAEIQDRKNRAAAQHKALDIAGETFAEADAAYKFATVNMTPTTKSLISGSNNSLFLTIQSLKSDSQSVKDSVLKLVEGIQSSQDLNYSNLSVNMVNRLTPERMNDVVRHILQASKGDLREEIPAAFLEAEFMRLAQNNSQDLSKAIAAVKKHADNLPENQRAIFNQTLKDFGTSIGVDIETRLQRLEGKRLDESGKIILPAAAPIQHVSPKGTFNDRVLEYHLREADKIAVAKSTTASSSNVSAKPVVPAKPSALANFMHGVASAAASAASTTVAAAVRPTERTGEAPARKTPPAFNKEQLAKNAAGKELYENKELAKQHAAIPLPESPRSPREEQSSPRAHVPVPAKFEKLTVQIPETPHAKAASPKPVLATQVPAAKPVLRAAAPVFDPEAIKLAAQKWANKPPVAVKPAAKQPASPKMPAVDPAHLSFKEKMAIAAKTQHDQGGHTSGLKHTGNQGHEDAAKDHKKAAQSPNHTRGA